LQEKHQILETLYNEKLTELESARKNEKLGDELEIIKQNENKPINIRSSHMFYINTNNKQVPKCTDDCIIY
jgi:hypothetical protein